MNRFAFSRTRSSLRVLCYHGAWTSSRPHFGNKIFIGMETFRRRLDALERLGCTVLPLMEALDALKSGSLPPRAVAITIDDGWSSTFDFMIPELARRRYPATIYMQTERVLSGAPVHDVAISYALTNTPLSTVDIPLDLVVEEQPDGLSFELGNSSDRARLDALLNKKIEATAQDSRLATLWDIFDLLRIDIDELARTRTFQLGSPSDVRQAASAGFEIALHTHSHTLGDFSESSITKEISANRAALSEILDRPATSFRHFCWPSGDYTQEGVEHLSAAGIDVATTCDHGFVTAESAPLLLPRLLDGELTHLAEFVSQLSGAKRLLARH